MAWFFFALLLGVSVTLWTLIGGLRLVSDRRGRSRPAPLAGHLTAEDVAVLIPAHNEEVVIAATITSVLKIVPSDNVHVIADGCDDETAAIARWFGVHVLEVDPARGKAAGIETAVRGLRIPQRFEALLIVDADTELDEQYLERALPLLEDPAVVAVAGYARTTWRPRELSLLGRFLIAYRTRLYAVMQWIKFGQTWRPTNVTAIVPGFASMYKTSVLPRMDLNPSGLVIEDFNMTFEIHHKRLGKIAFTPSVFAYTQDPDNLSDYYRQVKRWQLGFWQTLRRHGFWPSWFSAFLALFVFEVLTASLAFVGLALAPLVLALPAVIGSGVLEVDWFGSAHSFVDSYLTPVNLLLFLFVPDYLLTCIVAVAMRRPSVLVYGVGFLFLRLVDATATLWTLPQARWAHSTGRWKSPARRGSDIVVGPGIPGAGPTAESPAPASHQPDAVDAKSRDPWEIVLAARAQAIVAALRAEPARFVSVTIATILTLGAAGLGYTALLGAGPLSTVESDVLSSVTPLSTLSMTALGLLAFGFVITLARDRAPVLLLAAQAAGLVLLLNGTTALADPDPAFVEAWRNAGLGQAASATVLRWAPAAFGLLALAPFMHIARQSAVSWQARWLAAWLFSLILWAGQEGFAPQAAGFLLFLVFVAALWTWSMRRRTDVLRPSREAEPAAAEERPRLPVLVHGAILATLLGALVGGGIVTHPFAAFFMAASFGLLAVSYLPTRRSPRLTGALLLGWLGLLAVVLSIVAPDTSSLADALRGFGADQSSEQSIDRLALSPALLLAGTTVLLAGAGLIRRARSGSADSSLVLLAVAPWPLVASQGAAALASAYLFALPFLTLLAGLAFFPTGPRTAGSRVRAR